jgi:hypothetical protein
MNIYEEASTNKPRRMSRLPLAEERVPEKSRQVSQGSHAKASDRGEGRWLRVHMLALFEEAIPSKSKSRKWLPTRRTRVEKNTHD